jgi:hypothetical protein
MPPEQREVARTALAPYGASLAENDFIRHGEKVLGVRVEVQKNRLRMVSSTGQLLASFPSAKMGKGISEFVERFWYWKPTTLEKLQVK